MGTVNVLEAVRQAGSVRAVVNVTSDKCYDNREQGRPFVEDDPKGGHDPYSSSKGCAELVADAYARSFFAPDADGPRLGSARAGNVIGGGDWGEDRLIPDIVRAALSGAVIPIRNPDAVRPWQHVLNPLSGYLQLAEALTTRPDAAGGWNFGPAAEDAQARVVDHGPARRAVAGATCAGRSIRDRTRTRHIISRWTRPRPASSSDGRRSVGSTRRSRASSPGTRRAARAESIRARRSSRSRPSPASPLPFRDDDDRFLPVLRRPARDRVRGPRACRRWRTPTCPQSARTRWSPSIRCARSCAVRACWCSSRSSRRREAIFSDYAYFSSYSTSWLEHSRRYVEQMVERWGLDRDSHVVELASNDGYLLQYFVERGIPVLGIEPAANVAEVAVEKGVPTLVEFFGVPTARAAGARDASRRPAARQQRARARPRSQRLRAAG